MKWKILSEVRKPGNVWAEIQVQIHLTLEAYLLTILPFSDTFFFFGQEWWHMNT